MGIEVTPRTTKPARRSPVRAVLVVDDDSDALASIADIVRDAGYRVETARDGQDAVEWMQRSPRPAALLLDLSMPRMNGDEVLKWLHASRRLASVPVCILSAEEPPAVGVSLAVRKPLFMRQMTQVLTFLKEVYSRSAAADCKSEDFTDSPDDSPASSTASTTTTTKT